MLNLACLTLAALIPTASAADVSLTLGPALAAADRVALAGAGSLQVDTGPIGDRGNVFIGGRAVGLLAVAPAAMDDSGGSTVGNPALLGLEMVVGHRLGGSTWLTSGMGPALVGRDELEASLGIGLELRGQPLGLYTAGRIVTSSELPVFMELGVRLTL